MPFTVSSQCFCVCSERNGSLICYSSPVERTILNRERGATGANSENDGGRDEVQPEGLGWCRTGAGAAGNLVRNNALRVADDSF